MERISMEKVIFWNCHVLSCFKHLTQVFHSLQNTHLLLPSFFPPACFIKVYLKHHFLGRSFLKSCLNGALLLCIPIAYRLFVLYCNYLLYQFSSVSQSRPSLGGPIDCSIPGLPVYYQLLELTKTHFHWVRDDIQPSHSWLSHSPPAFNVSQHQGLFQWFSSSHQVAKIIGVFTLYLLISFPLGYGISEGRDYSFIAYCYASILSIGSGLSLSHLTAIS